MARRKGHYCSYEKMFEDLMRSHKVPYVAVDEKKRPVTSCGSIKNFDFIIHSSAGNYLVDIKGKQFPQESNEGKNKMWWQNWIHDTDLEGLAFWKDIFGSSFTPLIIFAYQVMYDDSIFKFWDLYNYQEASFGLVACTYENYKEHAILRSEKWGAYYVKKDIFLSIIKPLRIYIPEIVS